MVSSDIKYDDKDKCPKCGENNEVKIIDTTDGFISECETNCTVCGNIEYWAYGFYQPH